MKPQLADIRHDSVPKVLSNENALTLRRPSLIAKYCTMTILFALAAYYVWFIGHFVIVIVYPNSDIDVFLYVKLLNRYKERDVAALLKKSIHIKKEYIY